jgi:acetylornithine deacetylase/succinyl-diaminopimelate desuccinylase-like protein
MTVSEADVLDLLGDLVRIDSVTPWLIPGGTGEQAVAAYMARWLDGLGLEITLDPVAPGRVNLLARLRGARPGPTLCLNAHSDTVGYAGWPDHTLVPRRDGDRLYGLGAADDKAGCAAAMLAVRTRAELGGDVLIACVADEEGVSIGTVFHTGIIRSGTYATYPSDVTLGIEIGTQPGETLADRVADLEKIFTDVRQEHPDLAGEVVVRLDRDPFRAQGHEPLLAALDAAADRVLGTPLQDTGLNAWTDAALMQAAGIPTVMIGPKGGNLHAPDEWVSISEVAALADLLATAIPTLLVER